MLLVLSITALMGAGCFAYSFYHFVFFARSTRPVARAVMWMIGGESVAMLIFTAFSGMELLGHMPRPPFTTALRWTAFVCTFASSVHMTHAIRRVQKGKPDVHH